MVSLYVVLSFPIVFLIAWIVGIYYVYRIQKSIIHSLTYEERSGVEAPIVLESPPTDELLATPKVPWLEFACEKCGKVLIIDDPLEPGQLAILNCPQCKLDWTARLPSIMVYETKKEIDRAEHTE